MQLGVISGTQLHKDWLPNGPGYLLSPGDPEPHGDVLAGDLLVGERASCHTSQPDSGAPPQVKTRMAAAVQGKCARYMLPPAGRSFLFCPLTACRYSPRVTVTLPPQIYQYRHENACYH